MSHPQWRVIPAHELRGMLLLSYCTSNTEEYVLVLKKAGDDKIFPDVAILDSISSASHDQTLSKRTNHLPTVYDLKYVRAKHQVKQPLLPQCVWETLNFRRRHPSPSEDKAYPIATPYVSHINGIESVRLHFMPYWIRPVYSKGLNTKNGPDSP